MQISILLLEEAIAFTIFENVQKFIRNHGRENQKQADQLIKWLYHVYDRVFNR